MNDSEISALVGYAYPAAVPVDGRPGWLRRKWVLRTSAAIDAKECSALGAVVTKEVVDALVTSGVSAAALEQGAPVVSVAALDERHAVVQTDFVKPGAGLDVGDAPMAATWGALQRVDARLGIEELEGLPRRYWKLLTPPAKRPDT